MYDRKNTFKDYEKIKEEIKFLTNSNVRLEILISLFKQPSTISKIHKNTQLNYSSITSNLNKLEETNHIFQEDEKYHLKTHTKIKLLNILYLNNNLDFIQEYSNFFNNHIVENDKLESLSLLPFIKTSQLLQADSINPYIATDRMEKNMMYEGKVRSLCIYLHPNCSGMIEVMMNQKSEFKVIVPPEFEEYIVSHASSYKTDTPLKNVCFDIKPLEERPIKIALTVSEEEIVISLLKKDGNFNKNCALVSDNEDALMWGHVMYNEFDLLTSKVIAIKEVVLKNNKD